MVFSMKFTISCDISYILRQFIIQLCGTISYSFIQCLYNPIKKQQKIVIPNLNTAKNLKNILEKVNSDMRLI